MRRIIGRLIGRKLKILGAFLHHVGWEIELWGKDVGYVKPKNRGK